MGWLRPLWCCRESCSSAVKGIGAEMSERGFVPAQLGSEREVLVTLGAPGELQPSGVLCREAVPTRGCVWCLSSLWGNNICIWISWEPSGDLFWGDTDCGSTWRLWLGWPALSPCCTKPRRRRVRRNLSPRLLLAAHGRFPLVCHVIFVVPLGPFNLDEMCAS